MGHTARKNQPEAGKLDLFLFSFLLYTHSSRCSKLSKRQQNWRAGDTEFAVKDERTVTKELLGL